MFKAALWSREAGPQPRELLAPDAAGTCLGKLHEGVNAEQGVYFHQQVNVSALPWQLKVNCMEQEPELTLQQVESMHPLVGK